MTEQELRETYPEFTVYVFNGANGHVNYQSLEYYVRHGKSYADCSKALNGKEGWTEKQDKDLFHAVRLLEIERQAHQEMSLSEFADRLRDIAYDIDSLLDDLND